MVALQRVVRNAETLAVVRVQCGAAIFSFNDVVRYHPIAAGMSSSALHPILDPFASPICTPTHRKAPCSMLWCQQLRVSLLWPWLGRAGIMDGQ